MKWKILSRFLLYLKSYWRKELLLLLLMLTGSIGGLASPYILKIIIDKAFPTHNYSLLVEVLLILVFIYLVRIAATFFSDYLYSWVSTHVLMDIRKDLFRQFIHMPMQYYQQNKTGDIIYKINNEVDNIQSILTNSILRTLNNIITITGLVIALCWLNYKLFLLSASVFPFIFLTMAYFTPRIRKTVENWRLNQSDLLGYFTEHFKNIRLVKSFNTQDLEEKRLSGKLGTLTGTELENTIYISLNRNILTFFIALGPVIVLWWGGREVLFSSMTTGALVAFMQYLMRLYSPATDMFSLHSDAVRAFVSMKRIFEVLEQPSHATLFSERKKEPHAVISSIAFENVYFTYNDTPVLENISLHLEAGKKYALVGESGCGKSTLADLICQFYQPAKGTVSVNGQPLCGINPYTWIDRVAVVNQECYLFHDTILENIGYGCDDCGDETINNVVQAVGIQVKSGNSISLSGGQKQQIAIARALLKRAEIFIFDESTSAMDSINEKAMFDKIKGYYQGKIVLLISHRISTIHVMDVDEIICMHKGQIVEKGTYMDLCSQRGYFWNLFKGQLERQLEIVE